MSDQYNDFNAEGTEEFEDIEDIITLYDEDDNQLDCEFIDYIEYEENEYIILLPVDEPAEESEVIIMEVRKMSDEEEEYLPVDDDEILNAVYDIFKQNYSDQFNFAD